MARNEEKAHALLNRWTTMRQEYAGFSDRRPFLSSDCKSLSDAERFRRQIVQEISQKVSEIQNAGAGEHAIRDLNDRINRLMKEKHHWEKRIVQLGGVNYKRSQPPGADDGVSLPGSGYYKYFGAAKNLPGVRELFEELKKKPKKLVKKDLNKHINPDYYGYRDEEDEELSRMEADLEKKLVENAIERWTKKQKQLQVERLHLVKP